MYIEKQKIEKGDKTRKNKGKGKAKLRMEGDNVSRIFYQCFNFYYYFCFVLQEYSAYGDYDEYDDFM